MTSVRVFKDDAGDAFIEWGCGCVVPLTFHGTCPCGDYSWYPTSISSAPRVADEEVSFTFGIQGVPNFIKLEFSVPDNAVSEE